MDLHLQSIEAPIAERQLEGQKDGNAVTLTVKIGKPFSDEDQDACWYCPYSIDISGGQCFFYGAGVDSLQALRIAISMIEADLTGRFAHLNLTWMGESDLGFSKQL
jgi:hypothetical protein